MENLGAHLVTTILAIPYFLVLFGAVIVGKIVYAKTNKFSVNEELTEKDNPALGITLGLYLLGLAIAVGGTVARGIIYDDPLLLIPVVLFSLISIGLMRLSIFLNDKFILTQFHIEKEIITDRNNGTAFVVGGSCVATGLIINGSWTVIFLGDRFWVQILTGLGFSLLYYVLGQLLLIVGTRFYAWLTPYDIHKTIEQDDNTAVGLSVGGFLVGLGIISWRAIFRGTNDILADILIALWITALGMALLLSIRILVDVVIFPKKSLVKEVAVEKNVAAGAIACICYIAIAIAYVMVLPMPPQPGSELPISTIQETTRSENE